MVYVRRVLAGIPFSAPCANAGCMQNAVVSKGKLAKTTDCMYV